MKVCEPIVTYSFIYSTNNYLALTLSKFLSQASIIIIPGSTKLYNKRKKLSLPNAHRTPTKGEILRDGMIYEIDYT